MLLIDEAEFDRQAGTRLQEARKAADVRIPTLAEHMGLSDATVRAHERGARSINPGQAIRYALLLGVTPGWLLFGELARPHRFSPRSPAEPSRSWQEQGEPRRRSTDIPHAKTEV